MFWKNALSILIMISVAIFFCLKDTSVFHFGVSSDLTFLSSDSNVSSLNILFLLLVGTVSLFVFSWGGFYMTSNFKLSMFYFLLSLFVLSMMILLLSSSIFLLILGWEGLGLTSFVLIIFYQNWGSVNSGVITMMTNRLGDAFLIIIISVWVWEKEISFSQGVLFLFLILASTKSAQWPFVSWLPAAMAAPTPVSALVHSSTLVTAGIWVLSVYLHPTKVLSFFLIWFGLLTLLIASLAALKEPDMKKLVALSTLSQLGFMFFSLSIGNFTITVFHVLAHALAKANLFLVVGKVLFETYSEQDSRSLQSSNQSYSIFFFGMVSLLSLSGVAFSSGFYSKEQILSGSMCFSNSGLSLVIICFSMTLTLMYSLKFLLFFLMSKKPLFVKGGFFLSQGPLFLLSSLSVLFGNFMNTISTSMWMMIQSMDSLLWIIIPLFFVSGMMSTYLFFFLSSPVKQLSLSKNLLKFFWNLESSFTETLSSSLFSSFHNSAKGSMVLLITPLVLLLALFY